MTLSKRFSIATLAVAFTIFSGSIHAQNRNFGAQTFTMDDGAGHTFTMQAPAGLGANTIYQFPTPPTGNPPPGFVNVGTAGQTLFWNATAGHNAWEGSSVITNNTNGNGTNVIITAPLGVGGAPTAGGRLEVIDGPKSTSAASLVLESNDGASNAMQLTFGRILNSRYEINAIEQGAAFRPIVFGFNGSNNATNVGIGMVPTNKLDVAGNVGFTGNTTVGGMLNVTGLSTLAAISQAGTANINNTGSAATTIGTGGTGVVYIGNTTGSTYISGSLISNPYTNITNSGGDGETTGSVSWTLNAGGYAAGVLNSGAAGNADGLIAKTTGTASTNRIFTANSGGTDRFSVNGDGSITAPGVFNGGAVSFTTLTSTGNSTIATAASTSNTFGTGAGAINSIGTGGGALSFNYIGNNSANNQFGMSAGTNQFGTNAATNIFGNSATAINHFGQSAVLNDFGNSATNNQYGISAANNNYGGSATGTDNFGTTVGTNNYNGVSNFTGAGSFPSLSVTTGASGFVLGTGVNATTFTSTATAARAISFPDAGGTLALTSDITTSVSGNANRIAKFTGTNTIGNSALTDNGTTLTYNFFTLVTGQIATLGASFTNTASNGRVVGITNNDASGGGGNSRALDINIPNSPVGTGTATGILFNVAGPGAGTSYDMLGTGSTWKVTNAGVGAFNGGVSIGNGGTITRELKPGGLDVGGTIVAANSAHQIIISGGGFANLNLNDAVTVEFDNAGPATAGLIWSAAVTASSGGTGTVTINVFNPTGTAYTFPTTTPFYTIFHQ